MTEPLHGNVPGAKLVSVLHCICGHLKTDHAPVPNPLSNATPCQHHDCDCSQYIEDPKYNQP